MQFQGELRARIQRVAAFVQREVVRKWHTNTRLGPARHAMRHDAQRSPWIEARLRAVVGAFRGDDPAGAVLTAGYQVEAYSLRESRRLIGVSFRDDPLIGPLMDGFREEQLARIRSLDDDAVDDLRDVLEDAERNGLGVAELADAIEERLSVASSKAEQFARSSTLYMNARITQTRQVASGIERFIWSTSEDERVRESHDDLDGETFSWDDLPTVDDEDDVAPGTPPNCRCVAIPVLPDEADEDEAEEDDEPDVGDDLEIEDIAAE